MKIAIKSFAIIFSALLMSCGGKQEKKEGFSVDRTKTTEKATELIKKWQLLVEHFTKLTVRPVIS